MKIFKFCCTIQTFVRKYKVLATYCSIGAISLSFSFVCLGSILLQVLP